MNTRPHDDHAPASRRMRMREVVVHGLILLIPLALAFPGTFLRGEMTLPGELLYDIPPWRAYAVGEPDPHKNYALMEAFSLFHKYYALAQRALENGEWPLWNHLENAGMPLHANYQTMLFYPPRLLHTLFAVDIATTLFTLLKVWLCGMTAFVCARLLGLSAAASRFFSVAWMLGGFNLVWCYWSPTDVAAWLPVLFLGVEWTLTGRFRPGFFAMTLGATLLLFAGAPETAFSMGIGLGAYFVLRLAFARAWGRRLWMPIGVAAAAWAVAIAVTAVQLIPFVEYLAHSDTFYARPGVEADVFRYSAGDLPTLFVPRFFGTDIDGNYWGTRSLNQTYLGMAYAGAAVWVAAALMLSRGRWRPGERARAVALLIVSVLCGLLAFRHPYLDFINHLPVFASMRPVYHVAFMMFALPLLAAMGIDRWFSAPRKARAFAKCAALPVLIGVAVFLVFRFHQAILYKQGYGPFVAWQSLLTAGFAAFALAAAAIHCLRGGAPRLRNVFAVVLACDLLLATRAFNHTSPRADIFPDTELTDFLRSRETPCRVSVATAGITLGLFPIYGIEHWLGYDGMYPRRAAEFTAALGDRLWDAMEPACAIDYYLYQPTSTPTFPRGDPECLDKVATLDGIDVYRNVCALPRAFLASRAQVIPDTAAMLSYMGNPGFNPARAALLESAPAAPLPDGNGESAGRAEITAYSSTRILIDVEAEADAVLVLADAYYPGWTAIVNGAQAAEIFPVYHLFRGIQLPAGRHTVEFRYMPRSFTVGLAVSTIALSASGALAVFALWRARKMAAR